MTTQYTEPVIRGMQELYGEGFLSPGGAAEMSEFIDGVQLAGARVLEIGSGLGGASLMLADSFGAGHVTGIDIDEDLVARAHAAAHARGLDGLVAFRVVEPGPLPFPADSFDAVLIKDVACHIEDKQGLFGEVARVLADDGLMMCADFFPNPAGSAAASRACRRWIGAMKAYGLTFHFERLEVYAGACRKAGLGALTCRDGTRLALETARREVERLRKGQVGDLLREALGPERFAARVEASAMRRRALGNGGLAHGYIHAAWGG